MLTEQEHDIQLGRVQRYYDIAQNYYEIFWYRGKGWGLHYGLWPSNVHNRTEAIIEENRVLADMVQVKAGDLILDAGCGVAGSGIWLAQNRGAKVVELNIVRKQLNKGVKLADRNRVGNALYFTEADYHRLPFLDGSFDVFWSLESIEHSDDVHSFIKEAFRVLKSGGRAVIAGAFKGKNEATEVQKAQLEVGFRAAGAFNDFRSAGQVAQLMSESGFVNVRNRDTTDLVMRSAKQMRAMCRLGLPGARLGRRIGVISQVMEDNTAWGVYQEGLFRSGVTSYNILTAEKR